MMETRKEYIAYAGDEVNSTARKMAEMGRRDGVFYFCQFNGIELYVGPGMSPEAAVQKWQKRMDEKAEAYRRSPEGIAAKAKRDAEEARNQRRHDASMAALPERFANHIDAIKWMMEYADNSLWTYIKGRDCGRVVAVFAASGYTESDCVNLAQEEYNKPDIMARYVIGQFMSGMSRGAVHDGLIGKFGKEALALLEGKQS